MTERHSPDADDPIDVVPRSTDDPYVIAEDRSDQRGPAPDAERWHGAVHDPDHPEFLDQAHVHLPEPRDPLADEARRLVVDDLEERRSLASAGAEHPTPEPPPSAVHPARPEAEPGTT